MAADEKWYFTKEQLLNSPSRKCGYDIDKELSCRQQAANFIQDMGQRLQVSQLCINTAIVYMHRFYVFHSLASFHRNAIAAAALFLAAKVEEQPRKLEHVIKVAHMCLHRDNPNLDTKSEQYLEQAQDLVFNENVLLQTLGFDVAIDHPHTHVVRCCHLVRASKDLAQTSYFMASNSLHLTTMCLQYKPTVVACFCIHLACKWSNWEIPKSNEGKEWFWYVDKSVTLDLLEQLTQEFLAIFEKCPTKLKRKMMSMNQNTAPGYTQQTMPNDGCQFEEPRKLQGAEANKPPEGLFPIQKSNSQPMPDKYSVSLGNLLPTPTHHQKMDYREYKEKKERERERMEREKQQPQPHQQTREGHNSMPSSSHHHSKTNAVSSKSHPNVQSRSSSSASGHKNYQQPPHMMQQNMHFQNVKDNRESSAQNFQSSNSVKDSNYLKQHPPHAERESKDYLGQYPQNPNVQHQNYSHKPESYPNYPHREGSRAGHANQYPASQSHHGQSQSLSSNNLNLVSSQREFLLGNQRDNSNPESQPQTKDAMSSSIRDIISQTVGTPKDLHSKQEQMAREKSRLAPHVHSNSYGLKNGREHVSSRNYHDLDGRKAERTSRKPEEDETVIQNNKFESMAQVKTEEPDATDDSAPWNIDFRNVKTEKKDFPAKTDLGVAPKTEPPEHKSDMYNTNVPDVAKQQAAHMKAFDPKYKSHYHSNNKSVDLSHVKTEKPNVPPNSELHKKIHEKQRMEANVSAHQKTSKELAEKHKLVIPGQSHADQRARDKTSPSKYHQKIKSVPRPSSLTFLKGTETVNFGMPELENTEKQPHPAPAKLEQNKNLGNLTGYQKPQKSHEFGAPGSLASTLPDTNLHKTTKSSSIFSPDSKIPPQNILSTLEKIDKEPKKVAPPSQKVQPTNKVPPSTPPKKTVPVTVNTTLATSTASSTGSLFSPPLPKTPVSVQRHRTSSSSSEPELIPVLTKLEETPGYENIIRERKIALTPVEDKKPESLFDFEQKKEKKNETIGAVIFPANQKPAPVQKGFSLTEPKLSLPNDNGKPTATLATTSTTTTTTTKPNAGSNFAVNTFAPIPETKDIPEGSSLQNEGPGHSDGHKKSEKKKKKEKHKHKEKDKDKDKDRSERKKEKKKHKDKDKERSKDKEKHRDKEKHKDKDKDKHREKEIDVVGTSDAPNLKITIPKEKINCGLKIKIKKEQLEPKAGPSDELKIKIRKDVIAGSYKDESKSSSKKRERSPKSSADLPHSKSAKTSGSSSHKSNGTEGSSRNSSSHKHSISGGVKSVDVGRTDIYSKMSQSYTGHQH